jgi:hypothetical protein
MLNTAQPAISLEEIPGGLSTGPPADPETPATAATIAPDCRDAWRHPAGR